MCFPFHTTQNMATSHVVLSLWGIGKTYINTIVADALAHGITRPSAAMVLIWNKHAPVIHVDLVCFTIPQTNQSARQGLNI